MSLFYWSRVVEYLRISPWAHDRYHLICFFVYLLIYFDLFNSMLFMGKLIDGSAQRIFLGDPYTNCHITSNEEVA